MPLSDSKPTQPEHSQDQAPRMTYYEVLGVPEDANNEALKKAYRHLALQQHPDKGGDDARFHEVAQAFAVLEDPKRRDVYDDELRRVRERAQLVEGAPDSEDTVTKAAAPRVKTAPTPGSKRSMQKQAMGGGWKALGTGATVLKALEDDVTPEAATEALFQKYAALPRNKEKRQEWTRSLRGEDKAALKACAKAHEKAQMEKWQKWLNK
mmetsp:Transcript_107094/g.301391  ORF Transcript_107094/g.301391 Transcript_107094/m.301391 type:complete len:209 (-) Transcript_107094:148-774(-)|eukprot:CAMPEP_0117503182 /NCGR_PEP_ID=MMETSP0784-20121206/24197_1 /TAXON_ID=39447 /ORGANISM="" /LENGTH=208 /DNA_ID=CAMNT_0005298489 /DNA_START=75 /DNA_END=701 /DNA_ORIENTATION=-